MRRVWNALGYAVNICSRLVLCLYSCVCVSSPVGSFNNWKLHTHTLTHTHTKSRVALHVLCHGTLVLGPFAAHCQGLPLESFDLLYCSVLCHCRIYIFSSWIYGTFIGLPRCHIHNLSHYITACQTAHCSVSSVCSTRVVHYFKALVRPPSGKLHLITFRSDERIEF